ncbi:glycosyltransferase [Herbiconiux sp. L3-i23]|uniref:glycosyltransferase n=1 Tax=Herbiconiux sp. L3-i23 TaxID=2905871 RepID=UPI00205FE386|nr:glycosyltransferase [Herbiconiux sp. L3-i23]BDI24036.1 hypothetical protein L3i23_28120 [Herbiconiux sp. L3-i23]
MSVVGWYVHHHGHGHLTRFLAIRPHLDHEVVVFSSLAAPAALPAATTWVQLARDDDPTRDADGTMRSPQDAEPTVRGMLHWAPLGHPGHTGRLAAIASHLAARTFAAFVVDVSVEVALFVRLLGVPPIVMTQPGERTDAAHRLAYDVAERIIAPWPAGAHRSAALDRVAERVIEVGGISRFDSRRRAHEPEPGSVLVLGAPEDRSGASELLSRAAAATPGSLWHGVGVSNGSWVDDPWEVLHSAEVVVSAAGQNSVADLAAADARAVVIPQRRPFDEQYATGRHLAAKGLAVVHDTWPSDALWGGLLDRARALTPRWSQWQVRGAAARAAAVITAVAARR